MTDEETIGLLLDVEFGDAGEHLRFASERLREWREKALRGCASDMNEEELLHDRWGDAEAYWKTRVSH